MLFPCRFDEAAGKKKGRNFIPARPRLEKKLINYEKQLHTRVREVNQVVLPVNKVDVEVVGISPTNRPSFIKRKPITAILESPVIKVADTKMMLSSERCAETIIWDASVAVVGVLITFVGALLLRHLLLLALLLFLIFLLLLR